MSWLWVLDSTGREWLYIKPTETVMWFLWELSNVCFIRRWSTEKLGSGITEYDMVSAYPA